MKLEKEAKPLFSLSKHNELLSLFTRNLCIYKISISENFF